MHSANEEDNTETDVDGLAGQGSIHYPIDYCLNQRTPELKKEEGRKGEAEEPHALIPQDNHSLK